MLSTRYAVQLMSTYLGQHAMPASLGAQTSVVDPEHKVRSLAVAPLEQLPRRLVRGGSLDMSVQAKLDGHATGLGSAC